MSCIVIERENQSYITNTDFYLYERSVLLLVTSRDSPRKSGLIKARELDTLLIMRNFLTYFAGAPDKESLELISVKL